MIVSALGARIVTRSEALNVNETWLHPPNDLSRPSVGRVYDYLLGGSSNFSVDRQFARELRSVFPGANEFARLNRLLLQRVVRFLADHGIRQFLDIGSGFPTVGSVHEVAQQVAPECRIAYVDLESIAIAQNELVLENNDRAMVIRGDMREPEKLLASPKLRRFLDTDEPIGVLMLATLHFLDSDAAPEALIERYRALLAPGSYLAVSHATNIQHGIASAARMYRNTPYPATLRTKAQISDLLCGFDLVDPGVVFSSQWRPDSPEDARQPERSAAYAAVGHKPA